MSSPENPTDASSTTQANGTTNAEEPSNPALDEPDAMTIVQKGQSSAASVTNERKHQLLLQARADRRKWAQQVPLPFCSARDPNNVWSTEDRLHSFQTSLACQRIPTVTKVLSELYGLENQLKTPEEIAQRVDGLVSTLKETAVKLLFRIVFESYPFACFKQKRFNHF